jgi:uncharacterized protein (TIGR00369 family)
MADLNVQNMSGIEVLKAISDGRIEHPSMAHTLGFRLTEVAEGRAVICGETSADYCNPDGTLHGAWAAALLDSCMGSAVHSTLPAGTGFTIVEFKIDFVRPIRTDAGKVRATGTVVNVGKRVGRADGVLRDCDDNILARGTSTTLLF